MGSFGLEYDIHTNVRLFAEHLSSPMQCNDHPGVNHAGVKLLAPINDFTLYSGITLTILILIVMIGLKDHWYR